MQLTRGSGFPEAHAQNVGVSKAWGYECHEWVLGISDIRPGGIGVGCGLCLLICTTRVWVCVYGHMCVCVYVCCVLCAYGWMHVWAGEGHGVYVDGWIFVFVCVYIGGDGCGCGCGCGCVLCAYGWMHVWAGEGVGACFDGWIYVFVCVHRWDVCVSAAA